MNNNETQDLAGGRPHPPVGAMLVVSCLLGRARASPACPAIGPLDARFAVLFLHPLGDTGSDASQRLARSDTGGFLSGMEEAGVRVLFPTATPIPYTLQGGRTMSAWYDRSGLPPTAAEHPASVEASVARLEATLRELEASGVPPSRVAVGGFSQGGGIALQLAFRGSPLGAALAGVFTLSSYVCDDSPLWQAVAAAPRRPPLFQRHGASDGYILPAWGEATATRLGELGVQVNFALELRLGHNMADAELAALTVWLHRTLGTGVGLDGLVKAET